MKKSTLTLLLMVGILISFTLLAWAGDDPPTANMRKACTEGNSAACFDMGERYRVIERDNKTAIGFFRTACDAGYMTGCTHGGILLTMVGTHGSAQWKEAKKMFLKACDAGEDRSCYNMGSLSFKEGRQSKAVKFFHKACEMGNQPGCQREKKLAR